MKYIPWEIIVAMVASISISYVLALLMPLEAARVVSIVQGMVWGIAGGVLYATRLLEGY